MGCHARGEALRDDTNKGFEGNYEKGQGKKEVMKKTVGIVSRKEQTTVLKFNKTRMKKISSYRSSNIYISTPYINSLTSLM